MELFVAILLLLAPSTLAQGLYSKNSPVLQVDPGNYKRLIEKSNYTSIVEFYAPWCGHCKNLKPEYEKAAKALSGSAKVAAINCDEEANKPFCGRMGIQGFPTLKIVKPKKKGGQPVVLDYQGQRTADAIKQAVEDKIPNHVTKLTDKTFEDWLAKGDLPKALFFTEKAIISPMVKGIAIDFLDVMDVAQIRATEKAAAAKFMVDSAPKAFFMGSGQHVPEPYHGEMRKSSLVDFFVETGAVTPNPEWPKSSSDSKKDKAKADKAKADKKKKSSPLGDPTKVEKPSVKSSGGDASDVPPTITPFGEKQKEEAAKKATTGQKKAPVVKLLVKPNDLQKACLTPDSTTCVLAIMSEKASDPNNQVDGVRFILELEEIAGKYEGRQMFPIYGIPAVNDLGTEILKSTGVEPTSNIVTLVSVNAKKGWWTSFGDQSLTKAKIASWIDGIKLGDFTKQKLPTELVKEVPVGDAKVSEEEEAKEASKEETPARDEL